MGLGAMGIAQLGMARNSSPDVLPVVTRSLRVAHITDCHTQPRIKTEKALKQVFRQINNMQDKPDLILNTGDSVLDANYAAPGFLKDCWDAWNDSIQCCGIPVYHCIGNHDIWKEEDTTDEAVILQGKRACMQQLSMQSSYYSFEKNGWKFIALDSIGVDEYALDDRQFTWLKYELDNSRNHPVCVFSHVPIISAASMMYAMERRSGKDGILRKEMHADAKRLKDLFFKHPEVKLCLSGHVHYIDEVDYLGVKYMCNGSVSGNWWKGSLDEFPPAYAIIDLFSDGSIRKQLIYY